MELSLYICNVLLLSNICTNTNIKYLQYIRAELANTDLLVRQQFRQCFAWKEKTSIFTPPAISKRYYHTSYQHRPVLQAPDTTRPHSSPSRPSLSIPAISSGVNNQDMQTDYIKKAAALITCSFLTRRGHSPAINQDAAANAIPSASSLSTLFPRQTEAAALLYMQDLYWNTVWANEHLSLDHIRPAFLRTLNYQCCRKSFN